MRRLGRITIMLIDFPAGFWPGLPGAPADVKVAVAVVAQWALYFSALMAPVEQCQTVVMTLPCNYRCRNLRKFSTCNEGGRVGPGAPHSRVVYKG